MAEAAVLCRATAPPRHGAGTTHRRTTPATCRMRRRTRRGTGQQSRAYDPLAQIPPRRHPPTVEGDGGVHGGPIDHPTREEAALAWVSPISPSRSFHACSTSRAAVDCRRPVGHSLRSGIGAV